MTKVLLMSALIVLMASSCKKQCAEQNYGDVVFKNKTAQTLKVKINNAIPTGCMSDNNGNLYAGKDCTAQITGNLEQNVTVLTDAGAAYWEFQISVGPCGTRVIEIQ